MIWMKPPPWLRLLLIYDMDEAPPSDYAYSEYIILMKRISPLTTPLMNIWYMISFMKKIWVFIILLAVINLTCIYYMDEAQPLTTPLWIYDMDEAPPPDYTYFEYMIWMKPPSDYAYYEYMIWIKAPPDYAYYKYMTWMKPLPWLRLLWIYDMDDLNPSSDYAYYENMIWTNKICIRQ